MSVTFQSRSTSQTLTSPSAIAATQADAQGPHESPIRAGEERILEWVPALGSGTFEVRARLVYDLNRYNARRLTGDQTELYRASLRVELGPASRAPAPR